jgi:hypothetical protein
VAHREGAHSEALSELKGHELAAPVRALSLSRRDDEGLRSVGISFSILVARIALIVGFASLTGWAVGVAVVTTLAALALDQIESDLPPVAEAVK